MKINLEVTAATTAIIVSIAALFVAWDQSQVMRAQQHAAVWPMINATVTLDNSEDEHFLSLDIQNVGVGPALIKHSEVRVNGTPIKTFEQFDQRVLGPISNQNRTIQASSLSGILGNGEKRAALKISWQKNEQTSSKFAEITMSFLVEDGTDINMEICYCSVFDKCWMTNNVQIAEPHPVEECPEMVVDPIERMMSSLNKQ